MVDRLWNEESLEEWYAGDKHRYQDAVLEQYKIYVEMADRISSRRSLSNTFFLSLNTAIFVLIGTFCNKSPSGLAIWLTVPLIVLLVQCFAWFYLIKSYRLLNTAKYKVVGELEKRLPASPYWNAEWGELGEGKNRSKYWPLSHIEQVVPALFGVGYFVGWIAALLSS